MNEDETETISKVDDNVIDELLSIYTAMKKHKNRETRDSKSRLSLNEPTNDEILKNFGGGKLQYVDLGSNKANSDDESICSDELNEEERIAKEKVERFIADISANTSDKLNDEHTSRKGQEVDLYQMKKMHNENPFNETPDNSSDEDVYQNFIDDLAQILFKSNFNTPSTTRVVNNPERTRKPINADSQNKVLIGEISDVNQEERAGKTEAKDKNINNCDVYLNPKSICWDQNETTVFLTVTLKFMNNNVISNFQVNYSSTFLSFR
jgi:hypothetical protein